MKFVKQFICCITIHYLSQKCYMYVPNSNIFGAHSKWNCSIMYTLTKETYSGTLCTSQVNQMRQKYDEENILAIVLKWIFSRNILLVLFSI